MRLWSVHPKYLDARGLVALWREGLLAQAVLRGRTNGYRHHPQLQRFRVQSSPLAAIGDYLRGVHAEALRRNWLVDSGRIHGAGDRGPNPAAEIAMQIAGRQAGVIGWELK